MAEIVNSIPAASRTFTALRDMGYDINSALSDIIDNSISEGKARNIYIWFDSNSKSKFRMRIFDDGVGMKEGRLEEAMRLGSSNENYEKGNLSKYGMGMKTASLSQAHKLTVISKRAGDIPSSYCWDMHHVNKTDKWDLFKNSLWEINLLLKELLNERSNEDRKILESLFARDSMTVVMWDDLKDFQKDYDKCSSPVTSKNFWNKTSDRIVLYLRLIFHRFISGEYGTFKVNLFFNGKLLTAFDPFCRDEEHTKEMALPSRHGQFVIDKKMPPIIIRRYILPTHPAKPGNFKFSSMDAWEEAKGVLSWNEAQGYYVYRNNRLINFGGWYRTKALDEHDKLARASIDLTDDHDDLFTLDVKRTRIQFPELFKNHLIDYVNKGFIAEAKTRYSTAEKKEKPMLNDVRGKAKKVSHLSSALVSADNITVTEFTERKQIVISNKYGSKISEDMTYKKLEAGQKIISAVFKDDTFFWKMVPSPDSDFQVLINKKHPFYDVVYGNDEADRKTTAIMDAFLFTMSFIELKCITENNEFLFEQMRLVAASVLKKFVEEKIIQ